MNNSKYPACPGTKFAINWANASPFAPAPTDNHIADEKTNSFVNLDLGGFERTDVTIAKRTGEPGGMMKEVSEVVVKKAAPWPPETNDQFLPLRPGESLWDPQMDPIRFKNILGSWGVADKRDKHAESRRNK